MRRWMATLGDWSYSIYLSHIMLIAAIGRPLAHLLRNTSMGYVLPYFVILPGVLFAGYLSFEFIERPLIRLLYRRRFEPPAPSQVEPWPEAKAA